MPSHNYGWGNGYVVLPKDHPLHGIHYYAIPENRTPSVHGGVTYSESARKCAESIRESLNLDGSEWVFGFDTAHGGDNSQNWSKSAVLAELERFAAQFEDMKPLTLFERIEGALDIQCVPSDIVDRVKMKLGDSK